MLHRLTLTCTVFLTTLLAAGRGAEDRFFDSGGVKIRYVVEGKGEPVLLIHGYTARLETNWQLPGIIKGLSGDYQVIALDNRGHGKSSKPHDPKKYGLEMAEDAVRLGALAGRCDGLAELRALAAQWPPERAAGQGTPLDPRADVYSLGATLYELLTLQPMFAGDQQQLLRQILHDEPRPPHFLKGCRAMRVLLFRLVVLLLFAALARWRKATMR